CRQTCRDLEEAGGRKVEVHCRHLQLRPARRCCSPRDEEVTVENLCQTDVGLAAVLRCSTACRSVSGSRNETPPIIGTGLVKAPETPFPYHMFIFHSDGTMLQSNPDAGDPNTSDINGAGVWTRVAGGIKGKFVEG